MPDALDIFVFVCWFAGGFVSGVSGIGGTMFAFPFLALAIPMHALIPLSCLVCFFKDACMIAMHVRFCRFDAMPWLLLGAVPGSFAGVYLLQICSGAVLQGAVGLLLLYYVYWQMTYRAAQGPVSHPQMLGAAAGFGAGLLGTLGVFFVLRATVTLVLQGMAGFYTPTVLTCAMYGAPGVILGTCIAFPVVKHISQQAFRKVLLCVIAVAGLVCLVRALG